MTADERDKITRLHLLNTLFPLLTGEDLYLAKQIQHAINFSVTGDPETQGDSTQFNQALFRLLQKYLGENTNFGFHHWNAAKDNRPFDPLFARQEVIAGLKEIAGHKKSMFIATGIRDSIQGSKKRWSPKLDREYEEAIDHIRQLAARWTTTNSNLTLIML